MIRQGSLFDLQELYNLEPNQRFDAIFSAIDIQPIFAVVTKKSNLGRPVELNSAAMIYSLIARITERIPFIKHLVKQLKNDTNPQWSIKKNSEGRIIFWYGFKGHLAVGISSQYILQSLFSSGNLNDGKAAIPLLREYKSVYLYKLYVTKHWILDIILKLFIHKFIEWDINLLLLIIGI